MRSSSAYGPALTALVSHFPEPKWDEETSQKAFHSLMQRLNDRTARRQRFTRAALAAGAAVAAAAAWTFI